MWIDEDSGRRDVEKRWHDPVGRRDAATYVVFVVALAVAAFAATVAWHSLLAGILVPVTLFTGTVGAFVHTYQAWRDGGVWVIWQGAAWVLATLFMFSIGVPVALR